MKYHLAYGKQGLSIDLPDDWKVDVISPSYEPALEDVVGELRKALATPMGSPPLREVAKPADSIGIVFSDITRPTPNHLVLPVVLEALDHVPWENITLFNALGSHRANTRDELCQMLGEDIVDRFRIVQNNAFDGETQAYVGKTRRGNEVFLNREFFECDLKILTGFIEPHFFAGFSGGGKAVMPGMAGSQTILRNHDAEMISNTKSTWGETVGNPIWEEIREICQMLERTFLVNVTLNQDKQITQVFAGEPYTAYPVGCAYVKKTAMVPVRQPYDLVITSNSGYPLDLNLYQAVKGMSAASQIVHPGGAILIAAECWDGIPDHGLYGELLRAAESPDGLLQTICSPGFLKQDQWQAQIQAKIQLKADVYLYTDNLTDDQIRKALLKPAKDLRRTAEEIVAGQDGKARICVLPDGPQTIPYIQ